MSLKHQLLQPDLTGNTMVPPSEFDYELIAVFFDLDTTGSGNDRIPLLAVQYGGVQSVLQLPGIALEQSSSCSFTFAQNVPLQRIDAIGVRSQSTSPIPDRFTVTPQMRVWLSILNVDGSDALSPVSVLQRVFGP